VALQIPAREEAPIADGAVIGQDRSRSALELETVLDDVEPLLTTIRPDQLAATLGALAGALQGRGEQLGENLEQLDDYLIRLNPHLPALRTDLARLADTLETYDGVADDLLTLLRNATVTMNTVAGRRDQLAALLADTTDAADYASGFLGRHGDRIIQVGRVSAPVLQLLATYAPEYPCVLSGLVTLQPKVEDVFRGGQMHIRLEPVRDGGKYVKGRDDPVYDGVGGPKCYGLPHPKVPFDGKDVGDGADPNSARPPTPVTEASTGYTGSGPERGVIDVLVGEATGATPDQVPDVAALLWGPLLRGTLVNEG
jgi:phospholipid/cholesterol/gamma-HCH transport system substrate-binding protein